MDTSPFHGATDTHALDFWWRLPWVSKPGWIPCCVLSHLCDPQIHLWCNTCWLHRGQHGSRAFLIYLVVYFVEFMLSHTSRTMKRYLPSNLAVLETKVLRSRPILSAIILSNSCRLWVLSLCSMSCEQQVNPCEHIRKCSPEMQQNKVVELKQTNWVM